MLFDRCPWYVAGPVLGLVIVGLRATLNKPQVPAKPPEMDRTRLTNQGRSGLRA